MPARVVEILDQAQAKQEMRLVGVNQAGLPLMAPKALSRALKLTNLKPAAANIIKQELLALGGEAATSHGAINCSVDQAAALLFGTQKQLSQLAQKLTRHQFGLPAVAKEIKKTLVDYDRPPQSLKIGPKLFNFASRPYLMGILNITPDSFSDGGNFFDPEAAVSRGEEMMAEGADIIDIGGESTRPGARTVPLKEELARVIPVIKRLARQKGAVISIDTRKAAVAAAAVAAGAKMVNDVSGLRFDKKMASVVAQAKVPICLVHSQGTPRTMQLQPTYIDLLGEIFFFLKEGIEIAKDAGILQRKIIVDPGLGFGKTPAHNLEIVRRLGELKSLGQPILLGPSRKSVIGQVLGLPVEERLEGTAALVAVAVVNGANIIRVHDVKPILRVMKMAAALKRG